MKLATVTGALVARAALTTSLRRTQRVRSCKQAPFFDKNTGYPEFKIYTAVCAVPDNTHKILLVCKPAFKDKSAQVTSMPNSDLHLLPGIRLRLRH